MIALQPHFWWAAGDDVRLESSGWAARLQTGPVESRLGVLWLAMYLSNLVVPWEESADSGEQDFMVMKYFQIDLSSVLP